VEEYVDDTRSSSIAIDVVEDISCSLDRQRGDFWTFAVWGVREVMQRETLLLNRLNSSTISYISRASVPSGSRIDSALEDGESDRNFPNPSRTY
jgi:hypothetical protein